MHPTIGYEVAKAQVASLRHQAQRDAQAQTTRRARRTPARLNVPGAQSQALFAATLQRSNAPDAQSS